ncbi:C40 family peptidase [Trichlorobacter lovleyi]|uniref:NlpC/P60 family protein n=1 Tax=Trichlorobacter lovleyi TaxID=313985 RepID=UPI002240507F|nr:NlpC/P60 family protein [Trichlorobacter lovleyi]QOX79693.1 C40 family peptidase [Trichlorobacter lovleyi]
MKQIIAIGYLTIIALGLSVTSGCASPKAGKSRQEPLKSGSNVKYAKGVSRLGYAIQMGAFSEVKNAERFASRLQDKGIEAFYYRKDNGIYAVRFGDFPSKEKARAVANRLVADRLIDGFYIAPPNEVVFSSSQEPVIKQNRPELHKPPKPYPPPTNELGLPADESTPLKPATAKPPATKPGERDLGYIAARTAERFVGIPYQWGGTTVVDGMDCSGFTKAVYNLCGVNIPRTSREQYKAGNPVSKSELRDGDLVFFGASESSITHVGIYVGNGKFVHAPRRGEEIKTASVDESYFERRFVGARRYIQ